MTSATLEGAQGIFSKNTFLKSVRSNEKDEVCYSFLVEIFTKSLHRGGVLLQYRLWFFQICVFIFVEKVENIVRKYDYYLMTA